MGTASVASLAALALRKLDAAFEAALAQALDDEALIQLNATLARHSVLAREALTSWRQRQRVDQSNRSDRITAARKVPIYSFKQAAQGLGVSPRSVSRWWQNGEFGDPEYIGKRPGITETALEAVRVRRGLRPRGEPPDDDGRD